jgi:hypothetical protein
MSNILPFLQPTIHFATRNGETHKPQNKGSNINFSTKKKFFHSSKKLYFIVLCPRKSKSIFRGATYIKPKKKKKKKKKLNGKKNQRQK